MEFLNRADDLAALEDQWARDGGRYFVLWGRRRVGKTELLNRFVDGKRAFYFEATNTTEANQLRAFSEELAVASGNQLLAAQPVGNWTAALAAIEQFASAEERSVVVMDEFQFLAKEQRELETLLNNWWRTAGRELPLVLIIAGSEVSFFREGVLGGQMYGRRDGQLQLRPFDHRAAALFTPNYSAEDKVRTFAVCGGMPYYLATWDDSRSLADNVLNNILYRDGLLHDEPELLLRQELPDPRQYFAVLQAVARGRTRNNEIVQHTGLDKAQVFQHLRMLERLQLVEQRRPVTASRQSLKTSYAILDGFLNFYFRFVEPYASRLRDRSEAERHLTRTVLPALDEFVSKPAWETICQQHIRAVEPGAVAVGAWWGQVRVQARRTEEREVDAVALDINGKALATATCKWTNAPMSYAEENLLTGLEAHIPNAGEVQRHYFFSRGGFSDSLLRLGEEQADRVKLLGPEGLYE